MSITNQKQAGTTTAQDLAALFKQLGDWRTKLEHYEKELEAEKKRALDNALQAKSEYLKTGINIDKEKEAISELEANLKKAQDNVKDLEGRVKALKLKELQEKHKAKEIDDALEKRDYVYKTYLQHKADEEAKAASGSE